MKNVFYTILIGVVLSSCSSVEEELSTDLINNPNSATGESGSEAMPKMKFEENSYDFGEISQGEKVEHSFIFKNKGNAVIAAFIHH